MRPWTFAYPTVCLYPGADRSNPLPPCGIPVRGPRRPGVTSFPAVVMTSVYWPLFSWIDVARFWICSSVDITMPLNTPTT